MITFENLKEDEIDIFIDFHKKLNNLIGFSDEVLNTQDMREYLKENLKSEEQCYIIAKENNEPVGLISIDFSNELEFNGTIYNAAIPLIFVEEKNRNGVLSYDLLKLALNECKKRGSNSVAISVEDNNPHKFLHFAISDTLIDINQEYLTDQKTVTQYILGISNINNLLNLPFSKLAKNVSSTRKDFHKRLQEIKENSIREKEA